VELFWYDGSMKPPTPEELEADNKELEAEGMMFVGERGKILAGFRGESPRIILDMREVTFITSAGLRLVAMTATRAAAAHGGFAIFGLQPAINEVFEICGLQEMIPIASDETEARSKLGQRQ